MVKTRVWAGFMNAEDELEVCSDKDVKLMVSRKGKLYVNVWATIEAGSLTTFGVLTNDCIGYYG